MTFSILDRSSTIKESEDTTFDVLIIGGGITGAGLAVQAAASGLKTALLEMQDFAEGTSSRSTKLVHGGIRYLKQFDVEVVHDTVTERAVIQKIAPHIPKAAHMLIPLYEGEDATFSPFPLKIAMGLYDHLAGVSSDSPWANRMLSRDEVLSIQPNLNKEGLLGGGLYMDFTNNDSRLVIENIKQAVADGGLALSHARVTGFDYDGQKIQAARVEDTLSGQEFSVQAQVIVNTTGPWSDSIRQLDGLDHEPAKMRPTKGVHLVVDQSKLKVNETLYFDSGEEDGRMIFVIPREGKTYFGTTDTDYFGDFIHPQVEQEDVDYLLKVINRHFEGLDLKQEDIESSWAGLRPLIAGNQGSDYNGGDNGSISDEDFTILQNLFKDYEKDQVSRRQIEKQLREVESNRSETTLNPSQVSRGSELTQSASGLLTLAGGKITDYRKMAEGAMDAISARLEAKGYQIDRVHSEAYPVSGGHFDSNAVEAALRTFAKEGQAVGLSSEDALALAHLYGSNIGLLLQYKDQADYYAEKYQLPLKLAISLLYGLYHEAVYTVSDYMTRRTKLSHFHNETAGRYMKEVANVIQDVLELSDQEKDSQIQAYKKEVDEMQLKHLS